jgi:phosphoribosylcarboxyaminoimidazole (NCAIR) mutase
VATVGIGSGGAKNAGLLAVEILALSDAGLQQKMVDYRAAQRQKVAAADAEVQGL